ncbi:tetratricopeptide repeat protein [Rhodococcus hoagii]|nr:tetratricopeptide repeat protein [Prescottella equi]
MRSLPDPHGLIWALLGLGLVTGMSGDVGVARACLEEVLAITRSRGESEYRARAMFLLGLSLWRQGEYERASSLFTEALTLAVLVDDGSRARVYRGAGLGGPGAGRRPGGSALRRRTVPPADDGGTPGADTTMLMFHEECRRRSRALLGERAFEGAPLAGPHWSSPTPRTTRCTGATVRG